MRHVRSRITGLAVLCFVLLVSAVHAQNGENIYMTGKQAYDRNDHLMAVEYLFAYLTMFGNDLEPGLADTIRSAIDYSEDHIDVALRTKKELDEKGHVTEVVVESSGKADQWGTQEVRKPFRPPHGKSMRKPTLPGSQQAKPVKTTLDPQLAAKLPKHMTMMSLDSCQECREKYATLSEQYSMLKERYRKLEQMYRMRQKK